MYKVTGLRALSSFETLEKRQLLSSATLAVGDKLFTAIEDDTSLGSSDLYVANLDGSNQQLLLHRDYGLDINLKTLFAYKNKLIFAAAGLNNSVTDEPFVSDGTVAGTFQLKDIYEGSVGSQPSEFHLVNGRVLFTASYNAPLNVQLYSTDGTTSGTIELSPYGPTPGWGTARNIVYTTDTATFTAYNSSLGGDVPFTTNGLTSSYVLRPAPDLGVIGSHIGYDTTPHNVSVHGDGKGHVFLTIDGQTSVYNAADVQRVYLYGGYGDDHLTADANLGKEVHYIGLGGNDVFSGGGNLSVLELTTSWSIRQTDYAVNLTLTDTGGTASFANGGVTTLHGLFKTIYTTRGNDTITGLANGVSFHLNDGDDSIDVHGSGNTIDGGLGADTIISNDASDSIVADPSDSVTQNYTVDSGGGTTNNTPPTINAHLSNGFLRVYGTDANDAIDFVLNGGDLVVSVNGVGQTFTFAQIKDIVVHAGAGDDMIYLNSVAMKTNLYGDAGNDSITGGSGKDRIYGGDGDDWIHGGDNHDTIYGEAGNDRLFGDNGHDYLDGGAGTNVLRGGASFDHLIFNFNDDIHSNAGDRMTIKSIVG